VKNCSSSGKAIRCVYAYLLEVNSGASGLIRRARPRGRAVFGYEVCTIASPACRSCFVGQPRLAHGLRDGAEATILGGDGAAAGALGACHPAPLRLPGGARYGARWRWLGGECVARWRLAASRGVRQWHLVGGAISALCRAEQRFLHSYAGMVFGRAMLSRHGNELSVFEPNRRIQHSRQIPQRTVEGAWMNFNHVESTT
jgi:hypothetical protein